MIAQSCAADQAHLRSHSGPGSGEVFHGSPTQVELASTELCCWRGYVSHSTSQKLDASSAQGWTERDATGQLVPDRAG